MAEPQQNDLERPRQLGVREYVGFSPSGAAWRPFLITSHGEVIAEIRPPSSVERPRRQPGALARKIWIGPDFDTLPADLLASKSR